ncbi:pyridoxal phosphate-dependent transferase [Coprinopsis sp. MPI-PUGE-AT-0042]|nr:pyridoxal phosphate-dependent transferase [Coprinopsis sp. MPI-PUGE-AT-0042]
MVRLKNRWLLVELIPMSSLSGNTPPQPTRIPRRASDKTEIARSIALHLFLLLLSTKDRRLYIKRRPLSPHLRQTFLSNLSSSPDILGSGGSCLLINTPTHANFESRLGTFFNAPQALLFNSGFDANVGFFSAVPQEGDARIYGPERRRRVALLGLQDKVLARLVTFGKALATTSAVVLANGPIPDYLLNYARPLIYTTSLSLFSVIAADASLTKLSDGTAARLSTKLLDPTSSPLHSTSSARISPHLLSLPTHITSPPLAKRTADPSPIIPLLTCRPCPLSAFLLSKHGINTRPITWPTVPKGKDRVRVCLHTGNTRKEVDLLVRAVVEWAEGEVRKEGGEVQRMGDTGPRFGGSEGTRTVGVLAASKL